MIRFKSTIIKRYNDFLIKLLSKYGLKFDEYKKKISISDKSKYNGNEEKIKEIMNRMKESLADINQIELMELPLAILEFVENNSNEIPPPHSPISKPESPSLSSFILLNKSINAYTFDDIVDLSQAYFNRFSIEKYIPVYY